MHEEVSMTNKNMLSEENSSVQPITNNKYLNHTQTNILSKVQEEHNLQNYT